MPSKQEPRLMLLAALIIILITFISDSFKNMFKLTLVKKMYIINVQNPNKIKYLVGYY